MAPDRLLPGEDAPNPSSQDAAHWTLVYRELIATKRSLIRSLGGMLEGLQKDARAELERDDMKMLKEELARFERRFGYWEARLRPATA